MPDIEYEKTLNVNNRRKENRETDGCERGVSLGIPSPEKARGLERICIARSQVFRARSLTLAGARAQKAIAESTAAS